MSKPYGVKGGSVAGAPLIAPVTTVITTVHVVVSINVLFTPLFRVNFVASPVGTNILGGTAVYFIVPGVTMNTVVV